MRVVLVGRLRDRERLRRELADTPIEIAGEADTMGDAHAPMDADAWLVAAATSRPAAGRRPGAPVEPLTAREQDVLDLLANGLPNKSIALRLGISDQTVKFHVASICGKLGAANRTEAVRLAIRLGLVAI
jgi:DNA-binding NarL/FixJ family response regulator